MSNQDANRQVFSGDRMRWVSHSNLRRGEKFPPFLIYIVDDPVFAKDVVLGGRLHKRGDRLYNTVPSVKVGSTTLDKPNALDIRFVAGRTYMFSNLVSYPLRFARAVYTDGIVVEDAVKVEFPEPIRFGESESYDATAYEDIARYVEKVVPGFCWQKHRNSDGFVYPVAETVAYLFAEVDSVDSLGGLPLRGGFSFPPFARHGDMVYSRVGRIVGEVFKDRWVLYNGKVVSLNTLCEMLCKKYPDKMGDYKGRVSAKDWFSPEGHDGRSFNYLRQLEKQRRARNGKRK